MFMRATPALVAAVLTLAAIPAAHAQAKQEIKWGAPVNASAYYWDIWAAIELGYMAEEGLTVTAINNDTPIQSLQFLATGAIDISSPNTEVAISAVDKGADFKFVAAEDALIGFVLVARPEIHGYADLRGKTLGVTQLQESTATMLRLLLEHNGVMPNEYQTIALGGSPNRYAALVRGAVAATMLSPPFDLKAQNDGMKKMGDAFEAFRGVGVVLAVREPWAKAHADALVAFLRADLKAERFLYDPKNKAEAVRIMAKVTKTPPEDVAKTYEAYYGPGKVMAPELELTEAGLKPWLDLRGSSENPARYMDLSYWRRALGR
jgi:ABC-type nitrate/sulfonate/bicarbonate transport system substrate-binding protein